MTFKDLMKTLFFMEFNSTSVPYEQAEAVCGF